jgi:hypothetical protein
LIFLPLAEAEEEPDVDWQNFETIKLDSEIEKPSEDDFKDDAAKNCKSVEKKLNCKVLFCSNDMESSPCLDGTQYLQSLAWKTGYITPLNHTALSKWIKKPLKIIFSITYYCRRIDRFFLVQNTKTGKIILGNLLNGHKIDQKSGNI